MKTILFASALFLGTLCAHAEQIATFGSEQEALTYCQGGGIVWLDLVSHRYVYKGSRFYGKGKNAAYTCETDAIAVGGRASQGK